MWVEICLKAGSINPEILNQKMNPKAKQIRGTSLPSNPRKNARAKRFNPLQKTPKNFEAERRPAS